MSSKIYPEIILHDMQIPIKPYQPHLNTLGTIYDQPHISSGVKCAFFCSTYKRCLTVSAILSLIGVLTFVILLTRNTSTSSSNPCTSYTTSDLASSVTLECFRYLWENNGCKGIVPNGYHGWWLRSPQGGKTILCTNGISEENCGAGSYGAIINNIYTCNLSYKGFWPLCFFFMSPK